LLQRKEFAVVRGERSFELVRAPVYGVGLASCTERAEGLGVDSPPGRESQGAHLGAGTEPRGLLVLSFSPAAPLADRIPGTALKVVISHCDFGQLAISPSFKVKIARLHGGLPGHLPSADSLNEHVGRVV
jgi:hypothetical protein